MITITSFETFNLDMVREHIEEQITHALAQTGMILFDGIQTEEDLLYLCTQFGIIAYHRDADNTGLTHIVKQYDIPPIEGYQAFTASSLALHTDGSSMPDPATLVVLWCTQPADEGGVSLFVDGKQIYQILAKEHPHILRILTTPRSAIFTGAVLPFYSSIFSRPDDGTMSIRFRYDDLGHYSTSVHDVLPTFLALLNRYTISFALRKYQGYILQNGRWLHGRTAFSGERKMCRVLIHTNPASLIGTNIHFGFALDSE